MFKAFKAFVFNDKGATILDYNIRFDLITQFTKYYKDIANVSIWEHTGLYGLLFCTTTRIEQG